jgi:hypothetical protein
VKLYDLIIDAWQSCLLFNFVAEKEYHNEIIKLDAAAGVVPSDRAGDCHVLGDAER